MTGAALVLLEGGRSTREHRASGGAAPCRRPRRDDCRCDGGHMNAERGQQLHICTVPGCGGMWDDRGEVIRLP